MVERTGFFVCYKITFFCLAICFYACNPTLDSEKSFHFVDSAHSGINFKNTVTESADFNILTCHTIYNGGGVGVADFDKNGLLDLVFSGNEVPSRIYLNQGDLQFKDITIASNFKAETWATGVSIVDLNADGFDDIYLSVGGMNCNGQCKNQLFLHQGLNEDGLPTFVEKATEYGLDDGLYTHQTAFLDYDLDGDLDAYLLRNVIDQHDKNAPVSKNFVNKNSVDQFLENQNSKFVKSGNWLDFQPAGYGLGLTINDFNDDNLPDIYVGNDFLSDDFMFLNKGLVDGRFAGFEEVAQQYLKHTTYNSMGVDVADLSGDGLPEIYTLDMMPDYHERQKTMIGVMNYDKFLMTLQRGYSPQFLRNTLQVHNGFLNGNLLPFSEIGYLSGIYSTDWSWAPLLADFDNDGDRDIMVTNGFGKDVTDLDFVNYSNKSIRFGTPDSKKKRMYEAIEAIENLVIPNYFFENTGDLKFENRSSDWVVSTPSISNGAVYADLDNDGDLDLVVNNFNEKAYLLENQFSKSNFLKIKLEGTPENSSGIGSKIKIWTGEKVQTHYQSTVRGFLSSVSPIAHFGLGESTEIDSLEIIWADGNIQKLNSIAANQTLTLKIEDAQTAKNINVKSIPPFFKSVDLFDYVHQENSYHDFSSQPLLLLQHSRIGPCIATANVDGQPGEEIFIGGAKGYAGKLFSENKFGKWKSIDLPDIEKEDTDATFFDFDDDGDLDLYVVSGGSEFSIDDKLKDRIYINDGNGNFTKTEIRNLPESSGGCVAIDESTESLNIFIGGRVKPHEYPNIPQSSLLVRFRGEIYDYAEKLAYSLHNKSMVSDAIWVDFDNDEKTDLITVGEWSAINFYKKQGGEFLKHFETSLPSGFWNCIESADFDNDGDMDFLVGNLGKNSRLYASIEEPLRIYNGDLDQNGSPDPIIGQFYQNKEGKRKSYPLHSRDGITRQLVKTKKKYGKYADFAQATFDDLVGSDTKNELRITSLESIYIENLGDGNFTSKPLPKSVQIAPIKDILVDDFDNDGNIDALLIGNDFSSEKIWGWYDAFNGLLLKGNGNGTFTEVSTSESGFLVEGDGSSLTKFKDRNGKKYVIAGQNSGKLKFFEINRTENLE